MPHHECSSIAEGANCGRDQLHMGRPGPKPRPPMAQCEPRLYRYITYRSRSYQNRSQQAGWIVQWKGRTWGGYHDTQHDAAKTLQQAMGLPSLSELPRLPGVRFERPASRKSRFTSVKNSGAPQADSPLMKQWPVPQMHRASLRSRRP